MTEAARRRPTPPVPIGGHRRPPTPRPGVFETYWQFAAERHRIFEARLEDPTGPWSSDEILAQYRFCNTFRASDRVTQDLIRVAYDTPGAHADDLFVRVIIHRLFSKPSTWSLIDRAVGGLSAAAFDESRIGAALDEARAAGTKLYTGAFILCATKAYGYSRKHRNHLALVANMLKQGVPDRIQSASSLKVVFDELCRWPLLGPFMSYQIAIDLNYTTMLAFDENDFTVPGPGALRGIKKVFLDIGDLTPAEAIHWLVDQQHVVMEQFGIAPPRLFGRHLHAIDCQNLLCEVDKYCRVVFPELPSNRKRIKQRFVPQNDPLPLYYPPKWRLAGSSEKFARAA